MTGRTLRSMVWHNLEALHRMSWRYYSKFILLLISVSFSFYGTSFAAEIKAAEPTRAMALLSKEKAPEKKVVKTPVARMLTQKEREAKKKKGYAFPDADQVLLKEKLTDKVTNGTVTGAASYGLAVEYATDAKTGGHEIWFNYAKGVKFSGVRSGSDLQEGDTVSVVYGESEARQRLVKQVTLIRKKPKEEPAKPEKESE